MLQIEPHLLWLGHAGDCRDVAKILDTGIEAVVQLALEELPGQFPREIISARIPLLDGAGNSADVLRLAIATVEYLLVSRTPTLLCCSAGMSRTPAIAACAISRVLEQTPIATLADLQSRLATDISPRLWQDLLACSF